MRRIILIMVLIMVFSLAGMGAFVFASDDEMDRESLKGLNGVFVLIEDLYPNLEQAGLSKSQIKTDVELKLRLAGIKVLTEQEHLEQRG